MYFCINKSGGVNKRLLRVLSRRWQHECERDTTEERSVIHERNSFIQWRERFLYNSGKYIPSSIQSVKFLERRVSKWHNNKSSRCWRLLQYVSDSEQRNIKNSDGRKRKDKSCFVNSGMGQRYCGKSDSIFTFGIVTVTPERGCA